MRTVLREQWLFLRGSWLNVLLALVPISLGLGLAGAPPVWVFATAALAIVPLAGLIGQGTEATTEHTGPGIGGLLNATFGNATELIIGLLALREGLFTVVKASITGSILGNMLLVLGLAMLAGGWKRDRQHFNQTAAGASASMLVLAVAALIMPAVWDLVVTGAVTEHGVTVGQLSLAVALVLILVYLASLFFALVTHRDLYRADHTQAAPRYSLPGAVSLLLIATVVTAVVAEVLVGAIEPAAKTLGLTDLFVGVVIVAIVGNAAEHFTAVLVAARGQMDLAFQIAIGSSTQMALLIAPALVLASLVIAPQQMDLVFDPFEIVALALAVFSVSVASLDGESNWFEGLQLVAVYLVLAIAFFFVPG
ncbi:MAG: calcium/proton exchanger [Chloroflexota bacterium]